MKTNTASEDFFLTDAVVRKTRNKNTMQNETKKNANVLSPYNLQPCNKFLYTRTNSGNGFTNICSILAAMNL